MSLLRKALAVMVKDLRVVAQDRAYLISMLVFPLLITFMNASIFAGGESGIHLPVAFSNQDNGAYGARVSEILQGIKEIELSALDTSEAANGQVIEGKSLAHAVANFTLDGQ